MPHDIKAEPEKCARSWWLDVQPGESMTQAALRELKRQQQAGTKRLFSDEFPPMSGKVRPSRTGPI